MATMREMAAEYRVAAAKLKMKINVLNAAGETPRSEIRALERILNDIREQQRLLDAYYDVPRTETFTAAGWKAWIVKDDAR